MNNLGETEGGRQVLFQFHCQDGTHVQILEYSHLVADRLHGHEFGTAEYCQLFQKHVDPMQDHVKDCLYHSSTTCHACGVEPSTRVLLATKYLLQASVPLVKNFTAAICHSTLCERSASAKMKKASEQLDISIEVLERSLWPNLQYQSCQWYDMLNSQEHHNVEPRRASRFVDCPTLKTLSSSTSTSRTKNSRKSVLQYFGKNQTSQKSPRSHKNIEYMNESSSRSVGSTSLAPEYPTRAQIDFVLRQSSGSKASSSTSTPKKRCTTTYAQARSIERSVHSKLSTHIRPTSLSSDYSPGSSLTASPETQWSVPRMQKVTNRATIDLHNLTPGTLERLVKATGSTTTKSPSRTRPQSVDTKSLSAITDSRIGTLLPSPVLGESLQSAIQSSQIKDLPENPSNDKHLHASARSTDLIAFRDASVRQDKLNMEDKRAPTEVQSLHGSKKSSHVSKRLSSLTARMSLQPKKKVSIQSTSAEPPMEPVERHKSVGMMTYARNYMRRGRDPVRSDSYEKARKTFQGPE